MAYVTVPKDLTKIKTKVLFNLTKRQLVCFGAGALMGLPAFIFLKEPLGTSTATWSSSPVSVYVPLLFSWHTSFPIRPHGLPSMPGFTLPQFQ